MHATRSRSKCLFCGSTRLNKRAVCQKRSNGVAIHYEIYCLQCLRSWVNAWDCQKQTPSQDEEQAKRVCPQCGAGLVIRINRATKAKFTGCSMFPKCKYTCTGGL